MRTKRIVLAWAVTAALIAWQRPTQAQVVPGTGQQIVEVGDDFEDPEWSYTLNLPKASIETDGNDRQPTGFASNKLWYESRYRGTPDVVKRVEPPAGGISGSRGALALETMNAGIPGQLSYAPQQDDLMASVQRKLGYMLPASWTPSYVIRVYVPPFEQWEQRVGSSFGIRIDCETMVNKPTRSGFFGTERISRESEQYWPGFFFWYNAKTHPEHPDKNTATILIRADERGRDVRGPVITRPGWWTLGMSITPDGRIHYYGHEGVADLTAADHLYSSYPYGYQCLETSTFFFNILSQDDGRTWSTRWIIDDPKVYVATGSYTPPRPPQTAQLSDAPRRSQTESVSDASAQPASQAGPLEPSVPAE